MSEPPDANREVRRFHIRECVGSGGFGEVYRATLRNPGGVEQDVAIKVLHKDLAPTDQAVQRLRDEGKLLGMLHHPAIVKVHDLVVLEGRIALVTEFVEGADLGEVFEGGDLPRRALVDIVAMVAGALDAAERSATADGPLGLVHRDVKPANIRVGQHGDVKLLDFGIAKAAGVQREARTRAGDVIGSYRYMAPERLTQAHGDTPSVDVYALGHVLFEGLAGKRLFSGQDLRQQVHLAQDKGAHDSFVRERIDSLDIGPALRATLHVTLAHDPRLRPSANKIAALCDDMADALAGKNLRQWARSRHWPSHADRLGAMSGRTISDAPETTKSMPVRDNITIMAFEDTPTQSANEMAAAQSADLDAQSQTIPRIASRAPEARQTWRPEPNELTMPSQPPDAERSAEHRAASGFGWWWAVVVVGLGLLLLPIGFALGGGVGWALLNAGGTDAAEAPVAADVTAPSIPNVEPVEEPLEEEEPELPLEAAPAPVVAPSPKRAPAVEAPPKGGFVEVDGKVPVQLRRGGVTVSPGEVPAGEWLVYADFGGGWVHAASGPVVVPEEGRVSLKCSTLKLACMAQ